MKLVGVKALGHSAWMLRRMLRKVWVRASLFSLAAVVVALLAAFIGPLIPYDPSLTLASGAVDNILNILATSMLAVTTFSLSVMVSAYSAATSNATPRSTALLLADPTAQNTLSTFIGSFLFSVVGIVGIVSGLYDGKARILLFFATLIVLVIVVAALLRWIEHLGTFGRVADTIERVEKATRDPLEKDGRVPRMGAMPPADAPDDAREILPKGTGHVQHIDIAELEEIACEYALTIHVAVRNGTLVFPARALARVHPPPPDTVARRIGRCFAIGDRREFDNDPRFGLIVLSEIGSRALSPAVNDPGTAIEVADSGLRLLTAFGEARRDAEEPWCSRVHASEIEPGELVRTFFSPIARDGARILEFQVRLVRALGALARQFPDMFGTEARKQAAVIVERSMAQMTFAGDRESLKAAAAELIPDE